MNTAQAPAFLPGISRAIRDINTQIQDYARRPEDLVFLTGEPGTERVLAARLLHRHSPRHEKAFVRILATWHLPPDFADHLAGASGGTVLISLVREFPVDMQYTLLELALDRTFTDPMTGEIRETDVRLILTTALELETLFERAPILPDLREMLTSSHIDIPAIRERREDIPALVRFALQRTRETGQSQAERIDRQVLALFRAYAWPGNAEQLLLVAAQAALKATGPVVTLDDLPEDFVNMLPSSIVTLARSIESTAAITGAGEEEEEEKAEQASEGEGIGAEAPHDAPTPIPAEAFISHERVTKQGREAGSASQLPDLKSDAADASETPEMVAEAQKTPAASSEGTRPEEKLPVGSQPDEPHDEPQSREAETTQEILAIASRLYTQSALLTRQMKGPLPPGPETAREIAAARGTFSHIPEELEEELTRGLEQILALRRQLAILNQREQDSAFTIRDLIQRLELSADTAEKADAESLADHLAEIDAIIERITDRIPRISEDIQQSIRRILGKKQRG